MHCKLTTFAAIIFHLIAIGVLGASATATDIAIDYPSSPMPIGTWVNFSLKDRPPGYGVSDANWSYRYNFVDCADWVQLGSPGSQTATSYEGMPGTQTVRCQITYIPLFIGGAPYTETVTKDIEVAPPDTAAVVAGEGESTTVDNYCTTRYSVKSLGSGYNLSGLAQEYVSDVTIYGLAADDSPGSGINEWVPTSSSDTRYWKFHIDSNNTILDLKIYDRKGDAQAIWIWDHLTPLPFPILKAKQKLRIVLWDACGNPIPFELNPTFNLTISKNAETTYTISHDPIVDEGESQ